jgi:DNA-binding response OmpR family regulator
MYKSKSAAPEYRGSLLSLWGKRILVVEDDPLTAVDIRFHLEEAGAVQVPAPTNQRAVAYLDCHEVDAAIVDFHLPDGDCIPVLQLLASRGVPFVVVSGDTFDIHDIPGEAPVLAKPVTPVEVCRALSGASQHLPSS